MVERDPSTPIVATQPVSPSAKAIAPAAQLPDFCRVQLAPAVEVMSITPLLIRPSSSTMSPTTHACPLSGYATSASETVLL